FSHQECLTLAEQKSVLQTHACYIPMDFACGMGADLMARWLHLIELLKIGERRPLVLLRKLVSRAAVHYEKAFQTHSASSVARLDHLPTDWVIKKVHLTDEELMHRTATAASTPV